MPAVATGGPLWPPLPLQDHGQERDRERREERRGGEGSAKATRGSLASHWMAKSQATEPWARNRDDLVPVSCFLKKTSCTVKQRRGAPPLF